ncbi:MAG: DUF5696 domain-containing protein [Planctomycetia bacterium]|nr:DUF5696 domain-containing protein [Planctomycetia bacterium]
MKMYFRLLAVFAMLTALFTMIGPVQAEDLKAEVRLFPAKGKMETRFVSLEQKGNIQYLRLPKESIPAGLKTVEVEHPWNKAKAGEEGFYVFCNGMYGTFQDRPDGSYKNPHTVMPILGVKTPRGATLAIFTGMRYESEQYVSLKKGSYAVGVRFKLEEQVPYEDIKIEYNVLGKDATYSDMGRIYRKYQIDHKVVVPLKERVKGRPELAYAADSMEVRVRMGWKPVPSPVGEQNAENEPPMKPVITFDRFQQIVEEFKKQGVNKAEFCLVGWNIGGHDGRYPQIFPADPRLGGDEKLKEAVKKAQKEGFQIVCHTNYSDAYRASQIGGLWDENYLLRKKDGNLNTYITWGGGNMYETCPMCMYKRFFEKDFPKLKSFGFRGLHYIDVFSTVNPRTCWSKDHPLTKEGYAKWTKKIFAGAQKEIGGLGSEGGFDYCISNLDYALYISFHKPGSKYPALIERHVPLWHIVYNGIILNNPYTHCANYTIKDPVARLKLIEFGGRPMFYFYSIFLHKGKNWMGDADITCGTDEELVQSVKKIKEGYDEFEKMKYLQYEFMNDHSMIGENLFQTTFSDGTRIITNYNEAERSFEGKKIPAFGYIVLKP